MNAVIKSGGKQYRVVEGQTIRLETLAGEPGQTVNFEEVLMVGEGANAKIGAPVVVGAKVTGEVVEQGRHKKIMILKFKRRKHHMKRQGHRQNYTAVKITKVEG